MNKRRVPEWAESDAELMLMVSGWLYGEALLIEAASEEAGFMRQTTRMDTVEDCARELVHQVSLRAACRTTGAIPLGTDIEPLVLKALDEAAAHLIDKLKERAREACLRAITKNDQMRDTLRRAAEAFKNGEIS